MNEFFGKIIALVDSTQLPQQLTDVDYVGLFSNPWFLVPFISLVCYMLWKQKWRDLLFVLIFIGLWWASGTDYMQSLVVNGEVQIKKILPVLFGGACLLGFVIYLLFGRSD